MQTLHSRPDRKEDTDSPNLASTGEDAIDRSQSETAQNGAFMSMRIRLVASKAKAEEINNFKEYLLGGVYRRSLFMGVIRGDETFADFYSRSGAPGRGRLSALKSKQTQKEFFATIDAEAAKLGYDTAEGRAETARLRSSRNSLALNRYLMPLYRALREFGYNHHDLAC